MSVFSDPNQAGFARMTGSFYLIIAFAGAFSIAYVPSQLIVADHAADTVANVVNLPGLFGLGVLGDVIVMLAEIMITAMLFMMFRGVNGTLALAAALSRAMMVAVMAAMLFFQAGVIYLSDPQGAMIVLPEIERVEWAMLMVHLNRTGVLIWQVFFALHLLLLGALVARASVYPRCLGIAMMAGGLGYFLDSAYAAFFQHLDWLGYLRAALLVVVTFAEIGFAVLLLWTGRTPKSV